jgi:epoxyqueuosine reductase
MIELEQKLEAEARRLGFSLFGIAPATDADGFQHFANWLDRGFAGQMNYLHKKRDLRKHPRRVMKSVQSVVMLGFEYSDAQADAPPVSTATGSRATVARYAQGPDYHRVVWDRLNELVAWLEQTIPGCEAQGVADSAPLLERDFARRAGLGWFGKNTMLINKHRGSYFFLGGLLTSLQLKLSEPHKTSHCGTCTACLDACPTQAFPEPGVLDATKCISYLTIELRGPIPEPLREPMGRWIFGCDICQEVCPWNTKPTSGSRPANRYPVNPELAELNPMEVLDWTPAEFKQRFEAMAFWRTRHTGLLRNAAIVLGNTGDMSAIPVLERAIVLHNDEVIREAATWAVAKILQRARPIAD